MSEHTPTPWELWIWKHGAIEILDEAGKSVVNWQGFDDADRPHEEHEANARLIVRAVNENTALKQVLPVIANIFRELGTTINPLISPDEREAVIDLFDLLEGDQ